MLALGKARVYQFKQTCAQNACFRLLKHTVLACGKHVHKCKFVAVVVHADSVLQVNGVLVAFVGAYVHQYFVFDTPRKVCGKVRALFSRKSFHSLDKPDRTDTYNVLKVVVFGIFFRNVRNQSHIVANQFFACFSAAQLHMRKTFGFFLGGERLWVTAAAEVSRGKKESFQKQ